MVNVDIILFTIYIFIWNVFGNILIRSVSLFNCKSSSCRRYFKSYIDLENDLDSENRYGKQVEKIFVAEFLINDAIHWKHCFLYGLANHLEKQVTLKLIPLIINDLEE